MKITGELLKSERIKLKLSQQDIAFSLKLSPRTVNAIEEGDTDSLPSKTFVRGFVKSYAEMLKLDPVMVLSQFQEEMGTTRPISKVVATPRNQGQNKASYSLEENAPRQAMSSVTPNLKMNLNKNTLKLVILITLAVIVIGGINQVINKYQKEIAASPEASKLTVETLNQEANAKKELPDTGSLSDPASTPLVLATPEFVAPISQKPIEASNPAPETKKVEDSAPYKNVELVIEALKDTVISYAVGKETTFKKLELKKNTFQIIRSKNGLLINVEEGNSISITVNGIHKGLASSDAKPVKLSY